MEHPRLRVSWQRTSLRSSNGVLNPNTTIEREWSLKQSVFSPCFALCHTTPNDTSGPPSNHERFNSFPRNNLNKLINEDDLKICKKKKYDEQHSFRGLETLLDK